MIDDSNQEVRDPELRTIRDLWEAPEPNQGFHRRVLAAYQQEFQRPRLSLQRWRTRYLMPTAAVIVAAVFLFAIMVSRSTRREPDRPPDNSYPASHDGFEPVRQPRFIIVSQGEHP
jgi:hypothetical protein